MARSEVLQITADTWTQITNVDVSQITFQNRSYRGGRMLVTATADETPPVGVDGVSYDPDQGEYALRLSEGFPGVTGAARVWVRFEQDGEVFVSHA